MNGACNTLLSICMIVRNEERNLRRCLDSLPLIHRPWCELIIVDTGSTDKTIEIARQYTEQVYEHPWEGSFSTARNHAIGYAEGRWIMTIDADEQLTQDSLYKVERLVLNQESIMRPTIFITVRNFYDKACTLYHELLQPRLFLNDGDFRYEGAVHNRPVHNKPYAFCPQIAINHYGYLFQVQDGLTGEKVINRSLPMLLKQNEAAPDDLHTLLHLVKTYAAIYDADNVILYGEQWALGMRGIEWHEGWIAHLEGFVGMVHAYLSKGDIAGALHVQSECERYSDRISQIYFTIGDYYAQADEPEKAREYFERVVQIHDTPGSVYELLMTSDARMFIPKVYNWLAIYHYNHGELDKAGKYLNDGITANEGRLALRWDVWNERNSSEFEADTIRDAQGRGDSEPGD